MLNDGSLNLPNPKALPLTDHPEWAHEQCTDPIPYVFVGDDAFPLSDHCMKPFPQGRLTLRNRVYNYRLSRFRCCSENAFGIWVYRFRVFTTKMLLSPVNATTITLASLVLHNMLRGLSKDTYTPDGFVDAILEDGEVSLGSWRVNSGFVDFVVHGLPNTRSSGNRATQSVQQIREKFADHFFGPGAVPWQWNRI